MGVTKQLQACKKKAKEDILSLKHSYSEQIAQFSHRETKHQKEIRTLRSNEHIKSKRLTELEKITEALEVKEKQLDYCEKEKRARDRKIASLQKEIKRLQHESSLKDTKITQANASNKVFPVKMWEQDKKLYQGKMEKMKILLE